MASSFQDYGYSPILYSGLTLNSGNVYRGSRFYATIPDTVTANISDSVKNHTDVIYLHPINQSGLLNRVIPIEIFVLEDYLKCSNLYVKVKLIYNDKETIFKWNLSLKGMDTNNTFNIQMPFSYILDFIYENYEPGSANLDYNLKMSVSPDEEDLDDMYFNFISYYNYAGYTNVTKFTAQILDTIGMPPINGASYYEPLETSKNGIETPFILSVNPLEVDVSTRPHLDSWFSAYYSSVNVNGINITRTCSDVQASIINDFFDVAFIFSLAGENNVAKIIDVNMSPHEPITILTRKEIATLGSKSGDLLSTDDNIYMTMDHFTDANDRCYVTYAVKKTLTHDQKCWYNNLEDTQNDEEYNNITVRFTDIFNHKDPLFSVQDRSVHFSPLANGNWDYGAYYTTVACKHKRFPPGIAACETDIYITGSIKCGYIKSEDLPSNLADALDSGGARKRFLNYRGGLASPYADQLPNEYFCNRPFLLEINSPFGCYVGPLGDYQYTAFQTITFEHPHPETSVMLLTEFDRVVCELGNSGKLVSPWRHKMTVSIIPYVSGGEDFAGSGGDGTYHPDSGQFYSYNSETNKFTLIS